MYSNQNIPTSTEVKKEIERLILDSKNKSADFHLIDENLSEVINILKDYPIECSYNYISKEAKGYFDKISNVLQGQEYVIHQKVLLAKMMLNSLNRLNNDLLTQYIIEGILKFYSATTNSLMNNHFSDSFFVYTDDKFLKIQSICNLNTILINPLLLDTDRISIRFLFSHNVRQLIKGVFTVVFQLKGISPVYKFHNNQVDFNAMKFFNEAGVRRMFYSVSQLLKKNKKIKGVNGTSWFFDPVIKKISPELAFFLNIIEEIGGETFKHNTNEKTIKNALFLSKERKRLYDEGVYNPYNYVFIISRKKLIAWGEKNHDILE